MTCSCISGTEITFEIEKQKYNIVRAQKCFYVTREFYRFLYTEDKPNSPRQNNPSNFTEKGRCLQGCEFQGLFKT